MPATEQNCHGYSSKEFSASEYDDDLCTTQGQKLNLSESIPEASESVLNGDATPSPTASISSTSSFVFNSGFDSKTKDGTQESNTQVCDSEMVTGTNLPPHHQGDICGGMMPKSLFQVDESELEVFSTNSMPKHLPECL